jgi:hypothetical protein
MQFLLVPLLVVAGIVYLVMHRGRRTVDASRYVRTVALTLAALFTGIGALFVFGETFDDPGGWAAVGWIALWLVPLAGLTALAALRPRVAAWVLGALVVGIVAIGAWYAFDTSTWRAFEDAHGPIRGLAGFLLILPLAVLGRTRPAPAGALLLVAGVVPLVLGLLAQGGVAGVLMVVASPAALIGALYLLAAAAQARNGGGRSGGDRSGGGGIVGGTGGGVAGGTGGTGLAPGCGGQPTPPAPAKAPPEAPAPAATTTG